jgi:lysozyme
MGRTISPKALEFIKMHEGVRLKAYPDPGTGAHPWTIGYGHTGPEVAKGLTITLEQAGEYLANDVDRHARAVERLTEGTDTPQAAFDALVSFDFNTGALHRSTLLRKHLAGDHAGAQAEFARWKFAGGKVMAGLVRRRADEAAMYGEAYAAPRRCPAP